MTDIAEAATPAQRPELLRHGSVVFGAMMSANGANYVLHLFLVRKLGGIGYGTVAALLAVATIVSVAGIVVGTGLTQAVARERAIRGLSGIRGIADRTAIWALACAIAAVALAFALHQLLETYLHIRDFPTMAWGAALIGVSLALPPLRGVYQGAERYVTWGASMAAEGVGRLAITVPLVLAGAGTSGASAGLVAGSTLALAVTLIALPAIGPRVRKSEHVPIHVSPAMACAVLVMTIFQVYDLILAKHYLNATESGFYFAASIAGRILFMLVITVPIVLLPKAAHASTRGERTLPLLFKALAVTLAIAAVFLVVIALAPTTVATVIAGSAAAGASAFVLQYAIASTLLATAYVITTFRIGTGDLGFVPSVTLVLVLEFVGFALVHETAQQMLLVLMVGHTTLIAAALARFKRA